MLDVQRMPKVLVIGTGVSISVLRSVDQPTSEEVCLGCGLEFWRCACHGGEGRMFRKHLSLKPETVPHAVDAIADTLIAMAGFLEGIKETLSPLARGQVDVLMRRVDSLGLDVTLEELEGANVVCSNAIASTPQGARADESARS